MAMRSSTSPRRVYTRKGSLLVSFGGGFFGPTAGEPTEINPEKEVRIEELDPAGGRARVQVRQRKGKGSVTETWIAKTVVREPRA